MDTVAAAVRRVAYLTLTGDWPQKSLRPICEDERSFCELGKAIEAGRGVG